MLVLAGAVCAAADEEPLPGAETYLNGRTAERAARHGDALEAYGACAALDGPLAPYARARAAVCRAAAGDVPGGLQACLALLKAGANAPWTRMAQVELASLLAAQDSHAEAVPLFEASLSFEPKPWWVARYQWRAATSLVEIENRRDDGYAFVRNVVATTRMRDRRLDGAKLLAQSPRAEDRAAAAWGLIKSGERGEARTLLLALAPEMVKLGSGGGEAAGLAALLAAETAVASTDALAGLEAAGQDDAGNAWVRLSLAYLVRGQTMLGGFDVAQRASDVLAKTWPDSEHTAYALWWLAVRLREKGKHEEAIAGYERLVSVQPEHRLSDDALLAVGTLRRDAGDHGPAARTFARLAKEYPSREFAARAWYWAGRSNARLDDRRQAVECYRQAAKCRVGDFYAHRALQRLCDAGEETPEAGAELKADGSQPFLRACALPQAAPQRLTEDLQASPTFRRLRFFGTHGLEEAEWEALELARILRSRMFSAAVYGAMAEAGVAATAMDYARAFSWGAGEGRPTPARLRVDYPLAYWPHVRRISEEAGVDPYLVLAAARQESTFRPALTSYAGARGVMQVMPDTAKWLAKVDPNVEAQHASDLENPLNSLRLGAYYLVRMIDRSGGNLVYALASYNAGPGNCDKWRKRFPHVDLETFIESIPFSETRRYVKAVLGNYAAYYSLYPAPAGRR